MNEFWNNWSPRVLSILRFVSGFLMLFHGTQKLLNYPPSDKWQMAQGIMLVGGILELVGGILLMVGLFTRWTAFIMSGLMAVAYFGWHQPGGFLPIVNKGELAVLYCFVYFYLFFAGGGVWSLDNLFGKKE